MSESNSFYNAQKKSPRFSPIDNAFSEIRKMLCICNAETLADTKPQTESILNISDFIEQEHTFVLSLFYYYYFQPLFYSSSTFHCKPS